MNQLIKFRKLIAVLILTTILLASVETYAVPPPSPTPPPGYDFNDTIVYTYIGYNFDGYYSQFVWPAYGFNKISSKWFQPRITGSNPHEGFDVPGSVASDIRAVGDGTVRYLDDMYFTIELTLSNTSGGPIKIRYLHCARYMSVNSNSYVTKGTIIGKMGKEGTSAIHLHMDIRNMSGESISPFRYYKDNWYFNGGRDLAFYYDPSWSGSTFWVGTYTMDDSNGYKMEAVEEIRFYYRTVGSSTWQDGGLMYYHGDNSWYKSGIPIQNGTSIQVTIRIKRKNVSGYVFAPSRFSGTSLSSPQSSNAYWTIKMGTPGGTGFVN